jgi:hypothetical protein
MVSPYVTKEWAIRLAEVTGRREEERRGGGIGWRGGKSDEPCYSTLPASREF